MRWLPTFFFGLLTGLCALAYGLMVAEAASHWLRIPQREGHGAFWVIGMGLLALIGGTLLGWIFCRMVGGPGARGIARGFGGALAVVGAIITALGGLAWLQREVEPMVAGRPLDLLVEVRLPPGGAPVLPEPGGYDRAYVALSSGSGPTSRSGALVAQAARQQDGSWILPATIPIHVSLAPRYLVVQFPDAPAQFLDTAIPATPKALDAAWGAWQPTHLGNLAPPPAEAALALRYRIVARVEPEPPQPPPPPFWQAPITPEMTTEDLLARTSLEVPSEVRKAAMAVARTRPDFVAAFLARLRASDPVVARDAMYMVSEMGEPPREAAAAVRERAAEALRLGATAEPGAPEITDRVHPLVVGVAVASFGLLRVGEDLRPELRALAETLGARDDAVLDDAARQARRVAESLGK
jgi:hypothetical protein